VCSCSSETHQSPPTKNQSTHPTCSVLNTSKSAITSFLLPLFLISPYLFFPPLCSQVLPPKSSWRIWNCCKMVWLPSILGQCSWKTVKSKSGRKILQKFGGDIKILQPLLGASICWALEQVLLILSPPLKYTNFLPWLAKLSILLL